MDKHVAKSIVFGAIAGALGGGATALGASLGITPYASIWPVWVTCAILAALIHNAKQSITGLVDNRLHTIKNRVERTHRDIGDIHGLVRLGPYTQDLPLPIGGGWALTGDSAAILVREVLVRKPRTILELGSGVSTLLIGQILKQNGCGHLLSIDHDPLWANQTRKYVQFLGLQNYVTVVDSPLTKVAIGEQAYDWYGIPESSLNELGPIDFLFVDGPPQAKGCPQEARYPAHPRLRDRLSRAAVIFVDDANRASESSMISKWMAEDPGWNSQWFGTVDGVCMLDKDSQFQPVRK